MAQGPVGGLQQGAGVEAVLGGHGRPDRARDVAQVAVDVERTVERVAHQSGPVQRRVPVGVDRAHRDELAATDAGDGVHTRHVLGEATGELGQDAVAVALAELPVEVVEPVDPDQDHRPVLAGTEGGRSQRQQVLEGAPVGEPGEVVVAGLVAQPLLDVDGAGDVVDGDAERAVDEPVDAEVDDGVGDLGEAQAFGGERLAGVGDVVERGLQQPGARPAEHGVEPATVEHRGVELEQRSGGSVGGPEHQRGRVVLVRQLEQQEPVVRHLDDLGQTPGPLAQVVAGGDVDQGAPERFAGPGPHHAHQHRSVVAGRGEEPDDRFVGCCVGRCRTRRRERGRRAERDVGAAAQVDRGAGRPVAPVVGRGDRAEPRQVVGVHQAAQGPGLAERGGVPPESGRDRTRHVVPVDARCDLLEQDDSGVDEGHVVAVADGVGGRLDAPLASEHDRKSYCPTIGWWLNPPSAPTRAGRANRCGRPPATRRSPA